MYLAPSPPVQMQNLPPRDPVNKHIALKSIVLDPIAHRPAEWSSKNLHPTDIGAQFQMDKDFQKAL